MSNRQTNRSTGRASGAGSDNLALDEAQRLAQEQYDKLILSIRRNPLRAAAIAAGIGFVLALLARR